jgi:hypothetical protein
MNSGPLSEDELLGTPPGLGEAIEDLDHAGAGQRGVHLAGQPLPAERVDYVERPEFPARHQPILDEIHGPPLVESVTAGNSGTAIRDSRFRRRTASPSSR